jgi:hypothetical protein
MLFTCYRFMDECSRCCRISTKLTCL